MLTPLVFQIDPERAHKASLLMLAAPRFSRYVLGLIDNKPAAGSLETDVLGLHFDNPVGLAAGFDKDGQAIDGCLDLGFGFVEVGSVTPFPQPGNDPPRVFRLPADESVINRYGFNSQGAERVASILARRLSNRQAMLDYKHAAANAPTRESGSLTAGHAFGFRQENPPAPTQVSAAELGIVGVNLGKNKLSEDAAGDYAAGVAALGPLAHYLVVNVSSPNTPGLRDLQAQEKLVGLLGAVMAAKDALEPRSVRGFPERPPVLVKVSPDLSQQERASVAAACVSARVDGLVVANTTTARPLTLASDAATVAQAGGLSGAAVRDASTAMVADMYTLTAGKVPIIGVGGIASSADAYDKVRAGASLVQVYTGLVYKGPKMVREVKDGLADKLAADGFSNIAQAVGKDASRMCDPAFLVPAPVTTAPSSAKTSKRFWFF
jgi:dihydroorotate dehydrogenase